MSEMRFPKKKLGCFNNQPHCSDKVKIDNFFVRFLMVMFFPIQHEIDCISINGKTLGRIQFDNSKDGHIFQPDNDSVILSKDEEMRIAAKLASLKSGEDSIPMPEDD